MGRADKAPSGTLAPADYPRWVLSSGGGYFPNDPAKDAARRIEHQHWRRDRDAWMLKAGVSLSQVEREYRRRVAVWQETHPEDRGPFGRATTGEINEAPAS